MKTAFPIFILLLISSGTGLYSVARAQTLAAVPENARAIRSVLFLGDSLTVGYGVEPQEAYPRLFADLMQERQKVQVPVMNGSVSGSTTASGLSRLRWFLRRRPEILFLALGANDGLRGLSLAESRGNLEKIIQAAAAADITVVLAGMLMPANYGEEYRNEFAGMYAELAAKHELTFIPFLLEGVAAVRELNQADGIHPNEKGHRIIAETVYKALLPILIPE